MKDVATLDEENAQDLVVPRDTHKDEYHGSFLVFPSSNVDQSPHNSASTLGAVAHTSLTTLLANEDRGSILLTGVYAISH